MTHETHTKNNNFLKHMKNLVKYLFIKMKNKYQKHKEKLLKEARQRYQNLSGEEKDKK